MSTALAPLTPDLTAVKNLVLDAVSAASTRRMYSTALDEFFCWWASVGRPALNRAVVQSYRAHLEAGGLSPSTVNQKLSAIRKLAREASWNGLLEPAIAQGITEVKGAKRQ